MRRKPVRLVSRRHDQRWPDVGIVMIPRIALEIQLGRQDRRVLDACLHVNVRGAHVIDSAVVKRLDGAQRVATIVAGLRPGSIYVDMSTIEPDESRAVAAEFGKAGSIMLDGPISGSPVTVTQGNASVMIGGDEQAFERIKPVLLAIGPKVTRIGGNGLACQMKIAVNLLLMVEVIAFGEAVALAEKGGVARDVALDAILKSVAASPVLGYRGPFILEGKMPAVPLADVTLQQKDMMLALNLGRMTGSPVPLAAAANEMMNACRGLGIDGNDFVVVHQVYRRLGGQK